MKYLWTEDTGAGLHFWKLVNELFLNDTFIVESKGSNQGLLDAALDLEIKDDDKYYIAFDYVADNQDIRNKYRMLKSIEKSSKGKLATVYKGNIIKNLIMDCQSYTKYRPNETTGGIFVSWRRKEELPTGA